MTHILVPKHLADALRDYLSSRPSGETRLFINALEECRTVTVDAPRPDPPDDEPPATSP